MVGHESVRVKRKTGHKHEKHFIEEISAKQIGKTIQWEYRVYTRNVMVVEVPTT